MKVHTKTTFQWNEDGSFTKLEDEFHEYEGPVTLCNPVAAVASAVIGKKSADKASARASAAADATTEESRRQYAQTREDTAVSRASGDAALFRLGQLLGIDLGGATSSTGVTPGPAMTPEQALQSTPGYTFRLGESTKALDRMQSAGRITGGRAVKEATRYAQDYASGEFNNIINNLLRLGAGGQQATGVVSNAGMTSAGQVGSARMNAGNVGANAAMTGGMALNNAVQGGLQNYYTMKTYNDMMNRLDPQPEPAYTMDNVPKYSGF